MDRLQSHFRVIAYKALLDYCLKYPLRSVVSVELDFWLLLNDYEATFYHEYIEGGSFVVGAWSYLFTGLDKIEALKKYLAVFSPVLPAKVNEGLCDCLVDFMSCHGESDSKA